MTEDARPKASKATHVFVTGKKGEGKSELAWNLFASYPYDRLVIDPAGDLKVPDDTLELAGDDIPKRWPTDRIEAARAQLGARERRPQTIRYTPDFASPTYEGDIDRAIALAFSHPRTCLMVDEGHEAAPAGRTPPFARRALRQGRHRDLTQIWATPRPMTIDPLTIAQSDWVYVFRLPNPADRRRVADCIGWDPKTFDAAVAALGPHEYLRYDAARDDLAHMDPLPADLLAHHKD